MRAKDKARQTRIGERVRKALNRLEDERIARPKISGGKGKGKPIDTVGYISALKEYKAAKRTAHQ